MLLENLSPFNRAAIILGLCLLAAMELGSMAHADIGNPHPTPPSNTVTTAMIQNGAITPPLVQSTGAFTMGGLTTTYATTSNMIVTATTTMATTTVINGVTYNWTSATSSAGQQLTNDGSGNISWQTPKAQNLLYTLTAGEDLSANNAVSVYGAQPGGGVAFDVGATGSGSGTITVGNNTNRILLVSGFGPYAIGCSLNGSAMTQYTEIHPDGNNSFASFYAVAPNVGSNTISCTHSGAGVPWVAQSYYNAAQTGQPDSYAGSSANSTSVSANDTPLASGGLIVTAASNNGGASVLTTSTNFGTNQTTNSTGGVIVMGNTGSSATVGSVLTSTAGWNASGYLEISQFDIAPINPVQYEVFNSSSATASPNKYDGFLGFVTASVTSGNPAQVSIEGVVGGFTGLTPLSTYYLNDTAGTIGKSAGTNTKVVGTAISATQLIIRRP